MGVSNTHYMPCEQGHRSVGSHDGDVDSMGQGDQPSYHTHDTYANLEKCCHGEKALNQREGVANG